MMDKKSNIVTNIIVILFIVLGFIGQHRIYNKKEKGVASPKAEYA